MEIATLRTLLSAIYYVTERDMPRKPSINAVAITIKVPQSILDDAEIAAKNSPDAELANITRTHMLRIAMRRGLDFILAQQRESRSAQTAKTSKR